MIRLSVLLFTSLLLGSQPGLVTSQGWFKKMASLARDTIQQTTGSKDSLEGVPVVTLSNKERCPLAGLGVGNMHPEVVPAMVAHSLKPDKNIRLFDTSNVSSNEENVARGILDGTNQWLSEDGQDPSQVFEVHVITKVWYTHLGNNRTKISVQSSLDALKPAMEHPNVDLKVHVMIHWPRCYDNIPWMDCEQEEANLPDEVKNAGPPPHLDKENAWKDSWRALEEMYQDENLKITSIGVSNFHLHELEELTKISKVKPHTMETNAWSLLYDPKMIEFCHRNRIHLVAYHLMDSIIGHAETAPFAYHRILAIANDLTKQMQEKGTLSEKDELSAAQIVLAWLVQHKISVIPRTTDLFHLKENAASSLFDIPAMTDTQVQTVAHAVEALIGGEDLTEDAFVQLTFHAKNKDIYLYWHDPENGGEIQIAKIDKGKSFVESSHPGHMFRIYDTETKENMETFQVEGKYGEHYHIEL
mmetsp:Transcript_34968/g.84621  ORF Transcript_34968/g.84621 Transcript_34968/m.84621 type:complete len:472 (+) Transcript_34968:259-1674(+)